MNDAVKHTPGPWTIRVATASIPTIHVSSSRGHLASVFGARHVQDARLIAAAPELFDIAKEALGLAEIAADLTGCRGDDDFVQAFHEKAKAAIAKATGSEGGR